MSHQTRAQRLQHAQERLMLLQREQAQARAAYEAHTFGRLVPSDKHARMEDRWINATRRVGQQKRRIAKMERGTSGHTDNANGQILGQAQEQHNLLKGSDAT